MCQRAEDVGALGDRHCNKQPESAGKALAYEVLTDKHADGKGDAKDQGAGKQAAEHLRIVGCNGSGDIEPGKWKPSREQHGYVPVLEGRQEVEFEDADCIRHEFAEAAGRVEANMGSWVGTRQPGGRREQFRHRWAVHRLAVLSRLSGRDRRLPESSAKRRIHGCPWPGPAVRGRHRWRRRGRGFGHRRDS